MDEQKLSISTLLWLLVSSTYIMAMTSTRARTRARVFVYMHSIYLYQYCQCIFPYGRMDLAD